jgi:hypothetical protein
MMPRAPTAARANRMPAVQAMSCSQVMTAAWCQKNGPLSGEGGPCECRGDFGRLITQPVACVGWINQGVTLRGCLALVRTLRTSRSAAASSAV